MLSLSIRRHRQTFLPAGIVFFLACQAGDDGTPCFVDGAPSTWLTAIVKGQSLSDLNDRWTFYASRFLAREKRMAMASPGRSTFASDACQDDTLEPNNLFDGSDPTIIDNAHQQVVSYSNLGICASDVDAFVASIPAGKTLGVDFTYDESKGPLQLVMFHLEKQTQAVTIYDVIGLKPGNHLRPSVKATTARDEFIIVWSGGFDQIVENDSYEISFHVDEPETCTSVEDLAEDNDSKETPSDFSASNNMVATICPYDADWYRVTNVDIDTELLLRLDGTDATGDLDLELFERYPSYPPGVQLSRVAISRSETQHETVRYQAPASGRELIVGVQGYGSAQGTYHLSIERSPLVRRATNDLCSGSTFLENHLTTMGDTRDAVNDINFSQPDRSFLGKLHAPGADLFYHIEIPPRFRLSLALEPADDFDAQLFLLEASCATAQYYDDGVDPGLNTPGTGIAKRWSDNTGVGGGEQLFYDNDSDRTRTFVIVVDAASQLFRGTFSLVADVAPIPPQRCNP